MNRIVTVEVLVRPGDDPANPTRSQLMHPYVINEELAHFIRCAECGQAFDCRDWGQVAHHEGEEHRPAPRN